MRRWCKFGSPLRLGGKEQGAESREQRKSQAAHGKQCLKLTARSRVGASQQGLFNQPTSKHELAGAPDQRGGGGGEPGIGFVRVHAGGRKRG